MLDPFGRHVVVSCRAQRAIAAASGAALVGVAGLAVMGPYLAIGLAIGAATCIPIGVANMLVIDAMYRHGAARAVAVGLGGALADGIYASLGIFGVGPMLDRHPAVPLVLYGLSGCVLLGYGWLLVRAPPVAVPAGPHRVPSGRFARGVLVGLGATLLNPSAVVTWIVIVGSYAGGVTHRQGAAWVIGIVAGSFAWFCVVAFVAGHGRRVLRDRAIWMTRIVGILVIGSGVFSLARIVRALVRSA